MYSDNRSSFEDLLGEDKKCFNSCKKCLGTRSTDVLKVAKNFSAPLVREIFEKRNNVYDLRNPSEFVLCKVNSVFHDKKYFIPRSSNLEHCYS